MRIETLREHSFNALFTLIESQTMHEGYIFRGQSNSEWGLIPSLYRQTNLGIYGDTIDKNYGFFERRCLDRFFEQGFQYIPPLPRCYSNDRIIAQHFGVPTRFLDWSYDPLVALYFAVERIEGNSNAAIFMVMPDAHHLPEEVNSLGPHKVILVQPPAFDPRISAQKSVFTFHPYGPPDKNFVALDLRKCIGNQISVGDTKIRGFIKIIIPQRMKKVFRHKLLRYGIDRRNLFPGLEGIGQDISNRAATGHIW